MINVEFKLSIYFKELVPDKIGFEKFLKVGMSNRVLMNPSSIPIWDPIPSDKSIEKKRRLQKGAPGNFVKTSAMTMNASPVPWAAWSNSPVRLQFFSVIPFELKIDSFRACEVIKPSYSCSVIEEAFLPGHVFVSFIICDTSLE